MGINGPTERTRVLQKKKKKFITMHRDILNESITVESNQASVFAALTIYFRLNDNCNKNAFQ